MTQLCLSRRAEWNAHQRASAVAIWLQQGSRLRTVDVARLLCISWWGAYRIMTALSGTLPIRRVDGYWQWMDGPGGPVANDGENKGPAE